MLRSRRGQIAAILLVLPLLFSVGCRRSRSSGTAPSAPAPSASAPVKLTTLQSRSWLVPLEAANAGHPLLALPLGARRPRPIVVALHGDDDRPEWPCGSYHHAAPLAFVLCLRGAPREGGRYRLEPMPVTRTKLRAALPALKSRFGAYVAPGAVVLAALGPAVDQAIQLALEEPAFFARLVLIDGSLERLSSGVIQRLATAGGKRVLFVCTGDAECAPGASDHVVALKRAGTDARLLKAENARGLDGVATALVAREWAWLTGDDARWN